MAGRLRSEVGLAGRCRIRLGRGPPAPSRPQWWRNAKRSICQVWLLTVAKKKKKEQKECATPQGLLQPIAPVWSARSDVSHAEVVGVFIAGKNLFALRTGKGIRHPDRRRRTISRAPSPRRPTAHPPSHQLELRRCPGKPATPCTSERSPIRLSNIVSGRPISTRIAWGVGIFHMRGVVSCTAVVAGEAEQKGRPGASSPRCWNGGHVREPRPKMSSHLADRLGAGCSASHHLL